ncbi:hypothetical protein XHV734_2956 [Xanthomonas hortorum pv. vitians]|nr:hypothetical protein XHV734_2956 [Xanthomonas hortorum pv. vitians]
MDIRTRAVQGGSDPSNAGTEHLEERHSWLATVHTNHFGWSLSAHRRGTLRGMDAA